MSKLKIYDDSKYINKNTITLYANTNEEFLKTPVKGVIVELPGLGGGSCLGGGIERCSYEADFAIECGEKGVLVAYMFPGPWSWGNRGVARMTDAVVRAVADKYSLGDDFPLCVCGGSMGGEGAFNFVCDSNLKITACASACPASDVSECMETCDDHPRTVISAIASYDMPLDEAIDSISPIKRVSEFTNIPYYVCSDGVDYYCPSETCDKLVDMMRERGLNVIYRQQPGRLHGEFTPEVWKEIHEFLLDYALGK